MTDTIKLLNERAASYGALRLTPARGGLAGRIE